MVSLDFIIALKITGFIFYSHLYSANPSIIKGPFVYIGMKKIKNNDGSYVTIREFLTEKGTFIIPGHSIKYLKKLSE